MPEISTEAMGDLLRRVVETAIQMKDRADAAEAEAIDWRAQVGELSDEVKRLRSELAAARDSRDYGC